MKISQGSAINAAECFALAESVSFERGLGNAENGFLLGRENEEHYQQFFTEGQSVIAQENGKIFGFLVGYDNETKLFKELFTTQKIEAMACQAYFEKLPLFYIDKLAVCPTMRRKGIASSIYSKLFLCLPNHNFFTDVVESPVRNSVSIAFHLKNGFRRMDVLRSLEFAGKQNYYSALYFRQRANEKNRN